MPVWMLILISGLMIGHTVFVAVRKYHAKTPFKGELLFLLAIAASLGSSLCLPAPNVFQLLTSTICLIYAIWVNRKKLPGKDLPLRGFLRKNIWFFAFIVIFVLLNWILAIVGGVLSNELT